MKKKRPTWYENLLITRPAWSQTKTPCRGCCSTRISVSPTHYTFLKLQGARVGRFMMSEVPLYTLRSKLHVLKGDIKLMVELMVKMMVNQVTEPVAGNYLTFLKKGDLVMAKSVPERPHPNMSL